MCKLYIISCPSLPRFYRQCFTLISYFTKNFITEISFVYFLLLARSLWNWIVWTMNTFEFQCSEWVLSNSKLLHEIDKYKCWAYDNRVYLDLWVFLSHDDRCAKSNKNCEWTNSFSANIIVWTKIFECLLLKRTQLSFYFWIIWGLCDAKWLYLMCFIRIGLKWMCQKHINEWLRML